MNASTETKENNMAYSSKTLSVIGYAHGFTLWHYATPDKARDVASNGYFDAAADMMRVGDFILTNTGKDTTEPCHGIFVVAKIENGHVELTDLILVKN